MPEFRSRGEGDFPTLGWAVIRHGERTLVHPDGDLRGQPWTWTADQKWHILKAYEIHPVTGQRIYRRTCIIRPKKWGKGPFSAALALCEATGPCRFAGWTDSGRPIVVPVQDAPRQFGGGWTPWVQVVGTSEAQTNNIWVPLRAMLPSLSATTGIGIDAGAERVLLDSGASGRIEPVTSSATSREGQPVTFGACDEIWQWVKSNGGTKLAETIRRNVGGTSGWLMETTNAPAIGSVSVAENTVDAVETKGASDIFLDWRQPPGDAPKPADRDAVLREIEYVYGDHSTTAGGWVVPERQLAEVYDPDTAWNDALRFYMNRRSTAASTWISRDDWVDGLPVKPRPAAGTLITLGFDGSKGESEGADHTGLLGCDVQSGQLFVVAHLRPEQSADGSWSIPPTRVDEAVREAFGTWDVWRMYADPPHWGPWIAAWEAAWPDRVVSFDTTKTQRMAAATERFETAVRQQLLSHDGNPELATHISNAVALNRGTADTPKWLVAKEFPQSLRKVDLAVCAILAYEARNDAVADGALTPKPTYALGGF